MWLKRQWQMVPGSGLVGPSRVGPSLIGVLLMTALSGASAQAQNAANPTVPPTVIELFTSQGCSSCPAADALFEQFTKRADVVALSFSVHYWDQLGWKDTLASPKFTERQKAYAKARGDGQVYTPQIVVSGDRHAVGSDKNAIDAGIRKTQSREAKSPYAWLSLKLTRSAAGAVLEAPDTEAWKGDAVIWLAAVSRRVDVAVKRGENAGRTLTYFNAVRSFSQVGSYQGKAVSLSLDAKSVDQSETDLLVALVQIGSTGPIVGAATLAMK
jgi:hypothetical protein